MSVPWDLSRVGCIAALLLSLSVASGSGIQREGPGTRLASANRLNCRFPLVTSATWAAGSGQPEAQATAQSNLRLQFDQMNVDDGTGKILEASGERATIIVQLHDDTLHLVQTLRAGTLYVTTVFPSVNSSGRLKAVHSRHQHRDVVLPGFPSNSEQYFGDCDIAEN